MRRAAAGRRAQAHSHEQADLDDVVLVRHHAHARHAAVDQPAAQRLDGDGAVGDQRVGDVQRQRIPAQELGERADARESGAARVDQRRDDRKDRDAREQAAPRGEQPGHRRPRQRLEQPRHRAVVLVVVEHQQLRAADDERGANALDQRLARRAQAQRDHLQQRAMIPVADAEPGGAAGKARADPVRQRRCQHRLAAAAAAHQRQPRGRRAVERRRQRRELGAAPAQARPRRQIEQRALHFRQTLYRTDGARGLKGVDAGGRLMATHSP